MVAPISPVDRLQLARDAYEAQDYAEALFQSRVVAKTCPSCVAGPPGHLCRCKDLIAACEKSTSALWAELQKKCSCPAISTARCNDKLHIDALLYMGKIAMKTQKHQKGVAYAQSVVSLSPKNPEGYLILGAFLQVSGRHSDSLGVYYRGVNQLKVVDQARVKKLGPQFREQISAAVYQLKRTDPFDKLPPELKHKVFEHASMRTRGNSLRVSKRWNAFLSTAPNLWRHQHYDNVQRAIKPVYIDKFLHVYASGMVKSLQLDHCDRLGIDLKRLLNMLKLCPQLEHLKLDHLTHIQPQWLSSSPLGPRLTTLHFGAEVVTTTAMVKSLLSSVASSLEELTILAFPDLFTTDQPPWPRMPKLHTIRINHSHYQYVDIVHLASLTPNIRTAWIDHIVFSSRNARPFDVNVPLWPQLQRIFIGPFVQIDSEYGDHMLLLLSQLPQSLTEIVIEQESTRLGGRAHFLDCFMGGPRVAPLTTIAHLPNLKKVSLQSSNALMLRSYQQLLQTSLENGTLQELELYPFPWELAKPGEHSWFASESINLLGMSGFAVDPERSFDRYEDALKSLLVRCPNLRTLDINHEPIDHTILADTILAGVTTIYHFQGAIMTNLKNWAKGKGADVIHGKLPGTAALRAGKLDA